MFRSTGLIWNALKKFKRSYAMSGPCKPVVPCTQISAMPNGMTVATEETDSLLACVSLFVEVGPVYEKPNNYGITHFIEHVAYRGFRSMDRQHLEEYLASIGAKMSVLTTRDVQVFSGRCHVANVFDLVCILSKIVTELEVSPNEADCARYWMDIEASDADSNPKLVVSDYLHETAFQCTQMSRRIMGPSHNLRKFNKDYVDCFMKENYYPAKFILATSGAVNHELMLNGALKYFGCIEPRRGPNFCRQQRFTGSQIAYRDDSMPLAHVAIAVEAPGRKSEDYLPMLLASNMIGSWCKSQGGHNRHGYPLARAAATSNLCNRYESFYIAYRDVGLWGIYLTAEMMEIEDMISNVQDRWMHLCTTTRHNDVERGINATKVELAKIIEDPAKSCYDMGMEIICTDERRPLTDMYEILSGATAKTIKNVANKYLYDKCPAVSAVGPIETLPDYTRTRAGMYWLRL